MYATWPFAPLHARSLEEAAQWWQACYVPGAAERMAQGEAHWRIIVGGPGSGKSALLQALARHETQRSFCVTYLPEAWPGGARTLVSGGNHLAQIMAAAAQAVRDWLTQHPPYLQQLTNSQREFVRWLIHKHLGGARAFTRWIERFDDAAIAAFADIAFSDLYPDTTLALNVQAQIDELANFVHRLGYRRLLLLTDLNFSEWIGDPKATQPMATGLGQLFDWLDLMQHPGLAALVAVPTPLLRQEGLVERVRGRVSVTHLAWAVPEVRGIAEQHLSQAMGESIHLTECFSTDLLQQIETRLIAEFGEPTPAGWVALAETLVHLRQTHHLRLPFTRADLPQFWQAFFSRHMPLRLDPTRQMIWRGPYSINDLSPNWIQFLEILRTARGVPANFDHPALARLAGSKGNLHSIASRVRAKIEPFPGSVEIYLHHDRGDGGYWLENCL
jgi:hypothetical protein